MRELLWTLVGILALYVWIVLAVWATDGFRRHLAYASYLLRHKWYVSWECLKRGMVWRAITHDLSKFRPGEWFPYARHFYNRDGSLAEARNATGYYKPTVTDDAAFDFAWLLHQKRNRHHWQWWMLPEDTGGIVLMEMDWRSELEMVCDWIGAGKAQGHGGDVYDWYRTNGAKMDLHRETRERVEKLVIRLHQDQWRRDYVCYLRSRGVKRRVAWDSAYGVLDEDILEDTDGPEVSALYELDAWKYEAYEEEARSSQS